MRGWHIDPMDDRRLRWHDATSWTAHTCSQHHGAWVPDRPGVRQATIAARLNSPALLGVRVVASGLAAVGCTLLTAMALVALAVSSAEHVGAAAMAAIFGAPTLALVWGFQPGRRIRRLALHPTAPDGTAITAPPTG